MIESAGRKRRSWAHGQIHVGAFGSSAPRPGPEDGQGLDATGAQLRFVPTKQGQQLGTGSLWLDHHRIIARRHPKCERGRRPYLREKKSGRSQNTALSITHQSMREVGMQRFTLRYSVEIRNGVSARDIGLSPLPSPLPAKELQREAIRRRQPSGQTATNGDLS